MLCELTPVVTEAARTILDKSSDMACTGNTTLTHVEQQAHSGQFDALLLGITPPDAVEPSRHLLDADPRLKIVCVSPDGRDAFLHERRIDRTRIESVSFDRVFAAIRDACARE